MSPLFPLVASALAAPSPATPWPTDGPLIYQFRYGPAGMFTDTWGTRIASNLPGRTYTWTCTVKPARKNGRQEMTCAEPGLGEVWMLWGPGRELLQVDIDEDASDLGDDRHVHRVNVLAGALELWPATPVPKVEWEQGGRLSVLKAASNTTSSSFLLAHVITAVEGSLATIESLGGGTMLIGASSADTESRVEFRAEGNAVFDLEAGLLIARRVHVYPTRVVAGTYGQMGHELIVSRVTPAAAAAPTAAP